MNRTYDAKYIYNSLDSPTIHANASKGNITLKGIATKIMNLVQFISWVLVRDTLLCLCVTKDSLKFYKRLGFEEYEIQSNADFNLQERFKESCKIEGIDPDGGMEEIHPMYLNNKLLMSKFCLQKTEIVKKLQNNYRPIATNIYEYDFDRNEVLKDGVLPVQELKSVVETFYKDAHLQLEETVISEYDVKKLEEQRTTFASKRNCSEESAKKRVDKDQELYIHDKDFLNIGDGVKKILQYLYTYSVNESNNLVEKYSEHTITLSNMATNGDQFLGTILHKALSSLWVQIDAKYGQFPRTEAAKTKPVQKIHLYCGMCKQECCVNVEPLYTSYKNEIDENDGLVPWCLPKIIIESYLHKHIFNDLVNEDESCVPVLPATSIEWKTSDYEVPSFPSGCNKLQLYLQSKSDQSIHEEIEKSTDDDWVLRSELAGYFLSLLTIEGDQTLVTRGIRFKETLSKDLKQKLINYCPEYYQDFYKKAANTIAPAQQSLMKVQHR